MKQQKPLLSIRMAKHIIKEYSGTKERELFGLKNTFVSNCVFSGPGESPLKEGIHNTVFNCVFAARYALWENKDLIVNHCSFRKNDRAPLWYTENVTVLDSTMSTPKALRECRNVTMKKSRLYGIESFWQVRGFTIEDMIFTSYYPFLECSQGTITALTMKGKYSFQHCHDIKITKSTLDTKDAFWHSKNITITDSLVRGEYVGWYSENLTFIRCTISGTQPFVSAKNLKFVDCTFDETTDRAFEKSTVTGSFQKLPKSILNPKKAALKATDTATEVVIDNPKKYSCRITKKA